MRIQNRISNYSPFTPQNRSVPRTSTFSQQLDVAHSRSTDHCEFCAHSPQPAPVDGMELSPYCRLMNSYRWWKERQPAQELPGSQGRTAENIAYLRERYAGDLSWEERVDALETMEQMGVVTREQKWEAMGSKEIVIHLIKQPDGSLVPDHEPMELYAFDETKFAHDWNTAFKNDPFAKFTNIESILAWADTLPPAANG